MRKCCIFVGTSKYELEQEPYPVEIKGSTAACNSLAKLKHKNTYLCQSMSKSIFFRKISIDPSTRYECNSLTKQSHKFAFLQCF